MTSAGPWQPTALLQQLLLGLQQLSAHLALKLHVRQLLAPLEPPPQQEQQQRVTAARLQQ